jgi:prepilin-type N-terminal cleavage/methylation domain-containing protein
LGFVVCGLWFVSQARFSTQTTNHKTQTTKPKPQNPNHKPQTTNHKTMKKLHDYFCSGYTLIELLIAVSLSLLLLLGVTEMFRHVGSTMSDTQKSLNMAANLNATAMTLRSDLSKIEPALAHKPSEMAAGNTVTDNGYLEITEGMNAPYSETVGTGKAGLHVPINQVAANSENNPSTYDQTVGDVDDILAFTATVTEAGYPFRGLMQIINENPPIMPPPPIMSESSFAEIIWFVRGTTLYRRVLLFDEYNTDPERDTLDQTQQSFYARNDLSVHLDGTTIKANTMQELARRENRFAHVGTSFPFPLYPNGNEAWYFLRMPTLEETVHSTWNVGQQLPSLGELNDLKMNGDSIPTTPYWDFWENPNGLSSTNWNLDTKSGSLSDYVTPRNPRAGEDIVLKNVISFDVKVWNPYWVPCYDIYKTPLPDVPGATVSDVSWKWAPPQYVDLGQDQFYLQDPDTQEWNWYPVNYLQNVNTLITGIPTADQGYGFTLKGRYNTSTNNRRTVADATDKWHKAERLNLDGTNSNELWTGSPMPCVFDSWTFQYQSPHISDAAYVAHPNDPTTWRCPPPYTEDLQSIQITIRCFEPQSGNIKQVRVVQSF